VLTEIVFAWGGMGSFLYQAVFDRDFPVLQGGILFLAIVFVLVNLTVDIAYGLLDPRIRVR
jgi:peptide/nickel transport system permease protein